MAASVVQHAVVETVTVSRPSPFTPRALRNSADRARDWLVSSDSKCLLAEAVVLGRKNGRGFTTKKRAEERSHRTEKIQTQRVGHTGRRLLDHMRGDHAQTHCRCAPHETCVGFKRVNGPDRRTLSGLFDPGPRTDTQRTVVEAIHRSDRRCKARPPFDVGVQREHNRRWRFNFNSMFYSHELNMYRMVHKVKKENDEKVTATFGIVTRTQTVNPMRRSKVTRVLFAVGVVVAGFVVVAADFEVVVVVVIVVVVVVVVAAATAPTPKATRKPLPTNAPNEVRYQRFVLTNTP